MKMKIEEIKSKIRLLLLEFMLVRRLDANEYKHFTYILWSIEHFPDKYPDQTIRMGLGQIENELMEEIVIRINDEVLWLGREGVERSEYGADSYEKEMLMVYSDGEIDDDPRDVLDISGVDYWCNDMRLNMTDKSLK